MKHEQKTRSKHYDLTIIGGSGGLIAARLAAPPGTRVLLDSQTTP